MYYKFASQNQLARLQVFAPE